MKCSIKSLLLAFSLFVLSCVTKTELSWTNTWQCKVYPPEHEITHDTETGAKIIFVTTDTSRDANLYFDLNCWTADLSTMVFYSNRTGRSELFGYLTKTGELVKFFSDSLSQTSFHTIDYQSHDIYGIRENTVYQWHFDIDISTVPEILSNVKIKERKITSAPTGSTFFNGLTESADGKYLAVGLTHKDSDLRDIVTIDIKSGKIKTLLSKTEISHIQFNKYNPNLLRFSHYPHRMWYIDIRNPGKAIKIHSQEPNELVTHEDWWIDDQMTFCGGYRSEESHVKIVNIKTQETRIIGAGSWWPDRSPKELSRFNWWHASGSRDGCWVATDNWHGHIAIIDARSSHLRLLSMDNRPYGNAKIEHPHVGWAPDSKSVEFTTHKRGNPDVCIAYLPKEWETSFVHD